MGVIIEDSTEELAIDLEILKSNKEYFRLTNMKREKIWQPTGTFNVKALKCHPPRGNIGTLDWRYR